MITDSFDNKSPAIINPVKKENRIKVDACIITFSHPWDAMSGLRNRKNDVAFPF